MCQTLAVQSTEPEASLVPVQFQATECTFFENETTKLSFKENGGGRK